MNKASKAIKVLVVADIIMIVLGIILWFATKDANDFSGMVVVYPLIGFTIISICILILLFGYSLRLSLQSNHVRQPYWAIAFLIGIPCLGLFYAYSGDNRGKLLVICFALLLGGVMSVRLLLKKEVS